MRVANNISELIGDTPFVKLNRLADPDGADVYIKLEYFNPSGSIKDRAASNMLKEAEKQGLVTNKTTIIEPTSGNTGIGLAMTAAAKGYRTIIVMPDTMTNERINLLRAYGAKVILTPGNEKMPGAITKAQQLAQEIPDSFMPMQFENPANSDAHRKTTALEILDAAKYIGKTFSLFVAPAGTGGTITGTGETLKKNLPDLKINVVEPKGSPVLSGGKPGKHKLVGTSPGFIPSILNQDVYDQIIRIEDGEAYETTRKLAYQEGILVGPSSGASVFAALQAAEKLTNKEVVIAMTCDSGERYLSSDLFKFENGERT